MDRDESRNVSPRPPLPVPFFYGWVIVALTFIATLNGAGVRSALAVLIYPLETEFGWSRTAIAAAAALNLFLYGAAAPLSGYLLDTFGPRRVVCCALTLIGIGVAGAGFAQELWQFILLWGVVVGLGAGGMASVLSASIAHRWFSARRGLTLGILNSASSTGQLIFLPVLMALVVAIGWRMSLHSLTALCLTLAVLTALWMRDDPADVGLKPYGNQTHSRAAAGATLPDPGAAEETLNVPFSQAVKNSNFWLLCGSFFVCGGTANGLIGTHLIPHAIDRGIPEVTAAATVGVMGAMNFVGTLLSGYLTDRVDPRKVLSFVFALRGVALVMLPFMTDFAGLFIFAVIYGLDWFATVPPVVMLTGKIFGRRAIGKIYGWIFLSHQIGGALAAIGAGTVVSWYGDYQWAFFIGAAMTLAASTMGMLIEPQVPKLPPAELARRRSIS